MAALSFCKNVQAHIKVSSTCQDPNILSRTLHSITMMMMDFKTRVVHPHFRILQQDVSHYVKLDVNGHTGHQEKQNLSHSR